MREDVVSRALPFEEFCARGATLAGEGRLLVRLGDRWLPWRSAGPLLLSLLAYRRPLPNVCTTLLDLLLQPKDDHCWIKAPSTDFQINRSCFVCIQTCRLYGQIIPCPV